MKKYSIVLMIVLSYSTNYSQVDSLKSLFPLQIGNLWQYKITHIFNLDTTISYGTTEVLSDTLIAADLYFKVKVAHNGWPFLSDTLKYLRYDSLYTSVMEYSVIEGETLFFKLNALQDECWEYFWGEVCCLENDTVLIFDEVKQNKIFVKYDVPGWGYELAKDFGPIRISDDQSWHFLLYSNYNLVFAKINGIEYGNYITSIKSNTNSSFKYLLFQNYPNPFNPTTTIKIIIPKSSFVNLKVYDILGREVATLVNEEKHAGSYEVDFNGNGLSSGIYFYKLQTENYSSVKKMILIK